MAVNKRRFCFCSITSMYVCFDENFVLVDLYMFEILAI